MYIIKLTPRKRERARRILIKTKIISPAPTQNAEDHAIVLGASTPLSPPPPRRFPVPVIIAATSPCRPWPSCSPFPPREQLPATAVGGPVVVVVVVMAVLVLAFPWSSWSSHSWGCWVVACRSVVIFLPVVVVVVRVPVSSFGRIAPCLHPASSCSQRQVGVLSGCQLVPALRRPVVHPASRGSQRRCGRGAVSCLVSWGSCNVAGALPRGYSTSPGSLIPPM